MKFYKIILSGFLLVGFLILAGCSKVDDFGNMNNNPNATTQPNTAALLSNVESGLGAYVWGNGISTMGGLYCQYMSETQYTDASRYATQNLNWGGFYSGRLYDLQNIINYNADPASANSASANGSNANQIAVARILKAYIYWYLTDLYGDLPYFKALKGDGIIAYDKQDLIYADLIKELKEAALQFDAGAAAKGDLLFNGDISKWKKFANSTRLLVALRMSKKAPALARTEFDAAVSAPGGLMTSNADNAVLAYPGGNYNHPLYTYYNITQRFDYALSSTLASHLSSNNDRRLLAYGSSTKGFPYGLERSAAVVWSNANTDWSYVLASGQRTPSSGVVILGAANVNLALAEGANLGWSAGGTASQHYTNGIQRSWEQWGVYDPSIFGNYIAASNVALVGTPIQIAEKIATQQWVAFYPDGAQGFANWRKTGFPVLTPAPGQSAPIPRRIPYGSDEPNLNPANFSAAASLYTASGVSNSQNARVWWDQ